MAYKIAIASGKGGTGKTTVAVNMYNLMRRIHGHSVMLVDCDVEEPNDALFFEDMEPIDVHTANQLIPEINNQNCTYCRKCADYCMFNAIVVIPSVPFAEVNASMCHSCGACIEACQHSAITERSKSIGEINTYRTSEGIRLMEGKLAIGSAMQTMLIRELKKKIPSTADYVILDAPPGTSCPVVETIGDADFVVLVTEPTPFGLHDLKLMLPLVRDLNKSFGVVVNKSGLGDNTLYRFLETENIELLGQVPFNMEYAQNYSNGNLQFNMPGEVKDSYLAIAHQLGNKLLME